MLKRKKKKKKHYLLTPQPSTHLGLDELSISLQNMINSLLVLGCRVWFRGFLALSILQNWHLFFRVSIGIRDKARGQELVYTQIFQFPARERIRTHFTASMYQQTKIVFSPMANIKYITILQEIQERHVTEHYRIQIQKCTEEDHIGNMV